MGESEISLIIRRFTNLSIIASFYPNGEFTCGFSPNQKSKSNLGLSNADKSCNVPKRVNRKFTPKARRLVRNGCYLLGDKPYLSFLTLTLPPLSVEEDFLVHSDCHRLFNVIQTKITRWLKRADLPGEIVSVREYQRRGALHWHLVFVGRKRGQTWAISPRQFTTIWNDTLGEFIGRNIDSQASTNVQRVKRDAARYLSKYMTKQNACTDDASNGDVPVEARPLPSGRSWNISLSLRRRIKVNRSNRLGLALWVHRDKIEFSWLREIVVEGKVVALVGKLARGYTGLLTYLNSLPSPFNDT